MADPSIIHKKLQKRHRERLENMEKRRITRLKEQNQDVESAALFLQDFNKAKREIILSLNALNESQPKDEIADEFEKITRQIQTLQKYVSDSALFLPSYDVRRAQEISSQMRTDINKRRGELLPKKKFAFKTRQRLNPLSGSDSQQDIETPSQTEQKILSNTLGFSDISDETLTLSAEVCNNKDINLSNLSGCNIYIYGYPSAVRIQNVINSEIYCGPVSRSIFVFDCYDCILHLACQQLRIHSTSTTKFFVHVTCKAIIEDCVEVGFGSYSWKYPSLEEHFSAAGLDIEKNNWSDVDDFNWLKLDEKSPNWYAIE